MTDRLAELGALQWAVENLATAGTNPNRLGLAGYIHAAYTEYQVWAAANPGVNPNRLSARGRLYGYFYDNGTAPNPDAVIEALFANSEEGAWYDPSDLSTMFQDSAGTTPVTADGQPVGLILDKSGRGNHASQTTAASRPILVREPITGVRNLLTWTEDFSNASWVKSPYPLAGGIIEIFQEKNGIPSGTTVTGSVVLSGVGSVNIGFYSTAGGVVDTTITLTSTPTKYSVSYTTLADEYFNFYSATTRGFSTVTSITVEFPQLEYGSSATAYQKVTGSYDVTEVGVASVRALKFDGVDDSLSTAAIDFTATDKMSVFSGALTTSVAAGHNVFGVGDGVGATGEFELWGSWIGTGRVSIYLSNNGALYASTPSNSDFPINTRRVFSSALNINTSVSAEAIQFININSIPKTKSYIGSSIAHTNFNNISLYIGKRGNNTQYLSGNIYSLIIRGALSTAQEITDTETWVNGKTGAF